MLAFGKKIVCIENFIELGSIRNELKKKIGYCSFFFVERKMDRKKICFCSWRLFVLDVDLLLDHTSSSLNWLAMRFGVRGDGCGPCRSTSLRATLTDLGSFPLINSPTALSTVEKILTFVGRPCEDRHYYCDHDKYRSIWNEGIALILVHQFLGFKFVLGLIGYSWCLAWSWKWSWLHHVVWRHVDSSWDSVVGS